MSSNVAGVANEMQTLIATLIVGAIIGMAIARLRASIRRRTWLRSSQRQYDTRYHTPSQQRPEIVVVPRPTTDASHQLRIVMEAAFSAQPLLNKNETRVFRDLEAMVSERNPRWLVMAQVSLGEILRSQNSEAYSCINSKRVDLLIVDENCYPRHALEYQGLGHHQGTAAARDAVKKEALRRAGIGYHEVVAGQTTPSELRQLVQRLVESPAIAQPPIKSTSGRG